MAPRGEASGSGWRRAVPSLTMSLLARLPESSIGVLLVLSVRDLGHSYAAAGASSGVCAFAMALGGPVLGRGVDRLGPAPILTACGIVVALAALAFALLPDGVHLAFIFLAAAALGFAQPPVAASARGAWRRLLTSSAFERVVRLDATLQEISFMTGPLIFVTLATLIGAQDGLLIVGAMLGVIAVVFALLPEVRAIDPLARPHGASVLGTLSYPGIRVMAVVSFLLGLLFGTIELGVIQAAEHFDRSELTGVLLGTWGVGSIVVGLIAMPRTRGANPVGVLSLSLLAATVLNIPVIFGLSPVWIGFSLLVAGSPNAIVIGQLYSLIPRYVGAHEVTEAFSLEVASAVSGVGVGTMLAGLVGSELGFRGPFVIAVIAAGVAFLLVVARRRVLEEDQLAEERPVEVP